MSKKGKRSFKEKFALKNSLIKEALSEFLGTFVLIVSVNYFPSLSTNLMTESVCKRTCCFSPYPAYLTNIAQQ